MCVGKEIMSESADLEPALKRRKIANETKEPARKIELLPHQIVHHADLRQKFVDFKILVDTSETGSGKTYTAGKLAEDLNLPHILIICPVSAVVTWRPFLEEYGFKDKATVVSYSQIRTNKSAYLKREKKVTQKGEAGERTVFRPTDQYLDMIRDGLFLVVDEHHNAKNHSLQSMAVAALTQAVAFRSKDSRALLLSATPFDKENHLTTMIHLLGITSQPKLYHVNPFSRQVVLDGMADVIAFAKRCNPAAAEEINSAYPDFGLFRGNMQKVLRKYFFQCIQQAISSSMVKPASPHAVNIENGFFKLPETDAQAMKDAIKSLQAVAVRRREANQGQAYGPDEAGRYLAMMTSALQVIEYAKREVFFRLIRKTLQEHPKAKVIVFVSYLGTLNWLSDQLGEYKPLVMHGSVSKERRETIIGKIQAPSLHSRLLLGITKVCQESISLHDMHGTSERYLFISPSYNLTDLYQAVGRVDRVGCQSDAHITVVYSKTEGKADHENDQELKIRMALDVKAKVLRKTLHKNAGARARLPDQFPKVIEVG
jgi:hypothetical protein